MFEVVERVEEEVSPMMALAVAIVAVSTSAILIELSSAPSIIKALYRSLFTTLLLAPLAVYALSGRPSNVLTPRLGHRGRHRVCPRRPLHRVVRESGLDDRSPRR